MKKQTTTQTWSAALMMLILGLTASAALAHGDEGHKASKASAPISAEEHAFGRQGHPKKAARTIAIDMS
ncbi:MAG TPA: hypothetical protein VM571_08865, partial [Noviherbaspirillum sp.]|nr:hypothetical protein [Noviherbaspirillum sp.]